MITVYRIVKSEARSRDLTGTGAFKYGGRWNSTGTYMLYTSENASLTYLETLVHFDEHILPSDLFIITIYIKDESLIYTVNDQDYPTNWKKLDQLENKAIGDLWMDQRTYLGFKVKSAVNSLEYNYLLNPMFPGYKNLVEVYSVAPLVIDSRLIR